MRSPASERLLNDRCQIRSYWETGFSTNRKVPVRLLYAVQIMRSKGVLPQHRNGYNSVMSVSCEIYDLRERAGKKVATCRIQLG